MRREKLIILSGSLVACGIASTAIILGDDQAPPYVKLFPGFVSEAAVVQVPLWLVALCLSGILGIARFIAQRSLAGNAEAEGTPLSFGEHVTGARKDSPRFFRIVAAITGCLLCLTVAIWFASYVAYLSTSIGSHRPAVRLQEGAVHVATSGLDPTELIQWDARWSKSWNVLIPRIGKSMSAFSAFAISQRKPQLLLVWLIGFLAFIALLARRWMSHCQQAGTCRACGYDLRGAVSDRCSECGAVVSPTASDAQFAGFESRFRNAALPLLLVGTLIIAITAFTPWPVRRTILDAIFATELHRRDLILDNCREEIRLAFDCSPADLDRALRANDKALNEAGMTDETREWSSWIFAREKQNALIADGELAIEAGDFASAESFFERAALIGTSNRVENRLRYARARRFLRDAIEAKDVGNTALCRQLLEQSIWLHPTPEAKQLLKVQRGE